MGFGLKQKLTVPYAIVVVWSFILHRTGPFERTLFHRVRLLQCCLQVCMDREAPLLSGLCVFHEKPTLKFIVVIQCRSLGGSRAAAERGSEILGVIPRHRLQVERLLSTRRRLRRPASGDANHLELALQRSAADAI
eukprot:TRINITY_DN25865_c0_g1_i5.p2 TRINITY_DN25865_c0_g1~~TRINITY_DN25865_c0_g1_i5.p2  ORF type:complete len:136 (-),score=9.01 TRINITY_DN25865_c0_g1_i5:243-650(-)